MRVNTARYNRYGPMRTIEAVTSCSGIGESGEDKSALSTTFFLLRVTRGTGVEGVRDRMDVDNRAAVIGFCVYGSNTISMVRFGNGRGQRTRCPKRMAVSDTDGFREVGGCPRSDCRLWLQHDRT